MGVRVARALLFVIGLALLVQAARAQNATTYRYNSQATGINSEETSLTPANVNIATFGELFSDPVDGQTYAQALYLRNVAAPGKGARNIVYAATCHDSVYAFDADAGGDPIWKTSFLAPAQGITTVPQPDVISGDIQPEIGIVGTPVIDAATGTLYVVGKTKEVGRGDGHSHYVQKLHALDVATGAEKFGGPALIGDTTCDNAGAHNGNVYDYNLAAAPNTPQVPGKGEGSVNGTVYFNALRENERASLALSNGIVYVAWASHGDTPPYHGWVVGFQAQTLAVAAVWCDTPDGGGGGIWQSGCGPVIDAAGSLYFSSGNGSFDGAKVGRNWSQSFLRFFPGTDAAKVKIATDPGAAFDYFSPFNEQDLSNGDVDIGTGGMQIIDGAGGPVPHLLIGTSKEGTYYVMNRDNMGRFDAATNHVLQRFETPDRRELMSTPIYFNDTLYYNRNGEDLRARAFRDGKVADVYNRTANTFGGRGGGPIISAHGNQDAIVWMLNNVGPAELMAYSADALAAPPANPPVPVPSLYAGKLRDGGVKFTHPLVVDGKVYALGATRRGDRVTGAHLCVFGLLPPTIGTAKPETPSHLQAASDSPGTVALTWVNHDPNVSGFLIERSPGGADNFAQAGTADGGATSYHDNSVAGATAYRYRLAAVNKNGKSEPTAAIDAKSHDYLSENGLAACWSFDEGAGPVVHDLTGQGHDGTIVGEVSWSQGIHDTPGLEFHGGGNAQSHVEVKDSPGLDFAAGASFSVVAWARPASLPGHWAGAVVKSRETPAGWYGVYVSPDNHWAFRGPDDAKTITGGAVIPNSWQQVVAVQDGAAGTRTLYVDGVPVASGPVAQAADGTGPLWIGQANTGQEAFAGELDDVRIYNRALAAGEVMALVGDYLPSISLSEPADHATFAAGKEIAFAATASVTAPGTAIAEVRFFEGANQLGASNGNPAHWTWGGAPVGNHVVSARAVDTNGNAVETTPVTVTVGATPTTSTPAAGK